MIIGALTLLVVATTMVIKEVKDAIRISRGTSRENAQYNYDHLPASPLLGDRLTLEPKFNSNYAIRDQVLSAGKGEQLDLSNGLSLAVLKVEMDWQPADNLLRPENGKQFLAVTIAYGNRGKQKYGISVQQNDFVLKDRVGNSIQPSVATPTVGDNNFPAKEVALLQQRKGVLVFEVPSNQTDGLTLHYERNHPVISFDAKTKRATVVADFAL